MASTQNVAGLYIEIEPKLYAKLQAAVARERRTKRAIVELALTSYLKNKPASQPVPVPEPAEA